VGNDRRRFGKNLDAPIPYLTSMPSPAVTSARYLWQLRRPPRRWFTALVAASVLAACAIPSEHDAATAAAAHLSPPSRPAAGLCRAGEERLDIGSPRPALLYVPERAAKRSAEGTGSPLLLFFHGATQSPQQMLEHLRSLAEEHGVIVLAPASDGITWDAIRGAPGIDAAATERALAATFERCAVDRRHVAIGGFSDGASYALVLGLPNGDVFTHVLAFSACIVAATETASTKPRVFLSHGRADEILPFESCGRRIDRRLRDAGFVVRFEAFAGGHEVPPPVAQAAFRWLLDN
jgi:phospholipase/carboxylesterase